MSWIDIHTVIPHSFSDLIDNTLPGSLNSQTFLNFWHMIAEWTVIINAINSEYIF